MVKTGWYVYWTGLFALLVPSWLVAQTSSLPFSVPAGAGATFASQGTTGATSVGFVKIQANTGSAVPDAVGVLQYRANGVLVSEAVMPSSTPAISDFFEDRFFVEVDG